jgi:hypothetical protein
MPLNTSKVSEQGRPTAVWKELCSAFHVSMGSVYSHTDLWEEKIRVQERSIHGSQKIFSVHHFVQFIH